MTAVRRHGFFGRRALVVSALLMACAVIAPGSALAAPPAPTVDATVPPSPANDNTPEIKGTATAGTVVRLYTNEVCVGLPVAVASAEVFASPGITVTVADNTATFFYATAADMTGESPCSTTFVVYEEVTPPPTPVITDSDPDSPANNNMPFIKGTVIAGGLVRLYTNPACAEPRVGESTAAAFASPGIQVSVFNDAITTLYARVLDAAAIPSACSSGLTYVEDSTPPETTIVSGPPTTVPAGSSVRFEFSASEPGSRFECHLHEPGFQPCISPATYPALAGPTTSRGREFQVQAIDRAGNPDGTAAVHSYSVPAGPVPPPPPPLRAGCPLRADPILGTAAANTINGTARSDVILARAGNDLLRGLAGNDCLFGEAGSDRLRGGSGADRLLGGSGADRLEGESGNDRMTGGAGDDRLTDRIGRDTFSGGASQDRIDARDTSPSGRRVADTVICGTGLRDVVLADRRDRVLRDCERVTRR